MCYTAYVVTAAPAKRLGALALTAVLTTSTFLHTADVLNAPQGAYAWSHNPAGTAASVTGTKGTYAKNGVFVLFAGLVVLDIANAALCIMLGEETTEAAPAAPKAVEEAPAKDVEAAEPATEAPAAEATA